MRAYEKVYAWQAAHRLALEIYRKTALFPKEERYGLTSQMRRAAVSVMSNISEGYGRGTTKDYARFLYHSRGSLSELRSQFRLACDLNFIGKEKADEVGSFIDEAGALLHRLIESIERKVQGKG